MKPCKMSTIHKAVIQDALFAMQAANHEKETHFFMMGDTRNNIMELIFQEEERKGFQQN